MNGKIKNFNEDKGYGFILGDDYYDYFFHVSDVLDAEPLRRGTPVNFEPKETTKGKKAILVSVDTLLQELERQENRSSIYDHSSAYSSYNNRSSAIHFGATVIRTSQIKSYRIESGSGYRISLDSSGFHKGSLPRRLMVYTRQRPFVYGFIEGECGFDFDQKIGELDQIL